uniref:Biotin carboxyl carrier protein of acetyl-CoA carboxylase n=1 Tax=Malaconema sp. TaxID=2575621 RepID=A0A4D6WUK8_9FLOR|nr:acetyl-CoA carboxylase, biotin carboxyl carrier protein [Malaconema sp.]
MVGTFYRSPAPNEPVFIEQNDIVKKQQIVCIIEAMKLMNEIESEVNGKIIEILVKDGDIVDCGQALMKVQPIF